MRPPVATYRLQFRNGMTFDRAVTILPYLKRLGVSHLYASPIFTATTGSTHGYDVTDCNEIDPAIGGRDGFERLSTALEAAGLGLLLDIVPNHMAASLENPWWRSVIEWGADSPYGRHFDVDWSRRLTLPILGRPFAETLAAGELGLCLDIANGCVALAYHDHLVPLDPRTYPNVFSAYAGRGPADEIAALARRTEPDDPAPLREAMRRLDEDHTTALRMHLAALSDDHAFLQALHDSQPWQLTDWREARRNLSYRRFFEVTGLVGVRVEDDRVYRDVHRLAVDLVDQGKVDGLRVDHIDGLADPARYLERLRADVGPDIYLVVEKILEGDERLPPEWPIDGTTGYEFITNMSGLLTDETRAADLDRAYVDCREAPVDLDAERRAAKQTMVRYNFDGEVSALVALLQEVLHRHEYRGELSQDDVRAALCAVVVAFPVYRTYANADGLTERDRNVLSQALKAARAENPDLPPQAFDVVVEAIAGDVPPPAALAAAAFRTRFQQLTGPVMAKAVEDTLFYRFNRLLAVNEVGGDSDDILFEPAQFHARMAERVGEQPCGLVATSTHDTKRGEDARVRLYAISEAPQDWAQAVGRWRRMHAGLLEMLPEGPTPEPDTEWLIYQALAGVWPGDLEPDDRQGLEALQTRFTGFLEKAVREAKRRTSWTDVDAPYENAVQDYAKALLSPDNSAFLGDFAATIQPFIAAGVVNSLSQTLIKLTAPGIPDIYQGAEGVDLSLVDPDNRRPIDFDALSQNLRKGTAGDTDTIVPLTAGMKQRMIAKGLALRSERPDLFTCGAYRRLEVRGTAYRHVVAFERVHGADCAVTVVPRLPFAFLQSGRALTEPGVWADTRIVLPDLEPEDRFADLFTARTLAGNSEAKVSAIFGQLPFALLVNRTR